MNDKQDDDETVDSGDKGQIVRSAIEQSDEPGPDQSLTLRGNQTIVNSLVNLQEFFDVLPAAVYTCEAPSGIITFYNEQAVKLWGRVPTPGDSDERFCGSFRLWRPDGTLLPHDQTPMSITLKEGRSFRNEEVIIEQPDHTRVHVLVNIDPIRDQDGRLVGAINAFHDISLLKRAEEVQSQLAVIVESSDDAIVSKSLDGIIQSWNAGAERTFGYSAEEAVGQSINLIIPPELQDEEKQILRRLRQGEKIDHFETVRVSKSGERLDISLTISPIKDKGGQIIGASKVGRDITARKRTEKALRSKEAELELITETTPLILTRCSRDMHYLFANQAAASLFKLTPQEMIGKPIVDVMGEKALTIIRPYIKKVLEGETVEFETEMPYRGGGPRWVNVTYNPERDESGNVIGWVASIVDINKRKKAEEALHQLMTTLEERVQEKTKQVRHLASELITAEQSVRQNVAYLLHDDLQQLLFAVDVQLGFLQSDMGQNGEFDEVVEMVRHGIDMTRQLSVELSPPVLESARLIDSLSWLSQHMAETFQLDVTLETSTPPPTVGEDQGILLYHLVRELLFNVVKHAGVLKAHVSLQAQANGIAITVNDKGLGFDPAILTKRDQKHFGLRSVFERLELFGGKATIDSQPGAGTQVHLFLPHDLSAT